MRDPKGYYIALGVPEDADEAEIKAAYRAKAKRLHPDFNPSPVAAKQFHRLHEAYATLMDAKRRTAYDRPWKNEAKSEPKQERKQEAPSARAADPPPRPAAEPRAAPAGGPRQDTEHEPVLCQCGQITAQPRYAIFDMVWGQLKRVRRSSYSGVYCRACADRAAVRASLISWLAGWWAWPDGPRETVRAILNNIRGGRKPPDRNARLLLRQARAFQSRGDLELARNAAAQARGFARTPELRGEVERLIGALGPLSGRVLKDRWAHAGWAPMAQVMPLALIGAAIAVSTTMTLHDLKPISIPIRMHITKPVPAHIAPPPHTTGRPFTVSVDIAALRTGPSDVFQVMTLLKRGTPVTVAETDATGTWARVVISSGGSGFMAMAQLAPVSPATSGEKTPIAPQIDIAR